jgi:hypothetical protein
MGTKLMQASMRHYPALATLMPALALLCLICPQPRAFGQDRAAAASFAQASEPPRRPPARIVVRPLARTHPGPNSVRQCVSWLEPEYRLSGTVIVPRMHCWWEG